MTTRSLAHILSLVCFVCAALAVHPAVAADRIVASLSSHRVLIKPDFTGEEVVLFGTVESEDGTARRGREHDIVVTVRGPRQTLVTRRKDRMLGIWVNVESRHFVEVPSYLAVLATRPFVEIASPEVLRRLQVSLENTLLPQQIGPDLADVTRDDALRAAFIRLRREDKLYVEEPKGVTLLTPSLFRASIPLPASAPLGTYDVDIKLFENGAVVARATTALEVTKVGFEQFVASAAREHGVLYGLATVLMALTTGWLAAVAFRRD